MYSHPDESAAQLTSCLAKLATILFGLLLSFARFQDLCLLKKQQSLFPFISVRLTACVSPCHCLKIERVSQPQSSNGRFPNMECPYLLFVCRVVSVFWRTIAASPSMKLTWTERAFPSFLFIHTLFEHKMSETGQGFAHHCLSVTPTAHIP